MLFGLYGIDSDYCWALKEAEEQFHEQTDLYFPDKVRMIKVTDKEVPLYVKSIEDDKTCDIFGYIKHLGIYWERKDNFASEVDWLFAVREYEIQHIRFIYSYLKDNYETEDYYFNYLYKDAQQSYWYKKLGLTVQDILYFKQE